MSARVVAVVVAAAGLLALAAGCHRELDARPMRTGGDAARGAWVARYYGCGACHTIPGVYGAYGLVGPSLEHVAARVYLAGVLANTPAAMARWIAHPQAVHPGSGMPELGVTERDARDITAYLYAHP